MYSSATTPPMSQELLSLMTITMNFWSFVPMTIAIPMILPFKECVFFRQNTRWKHNFFQNSASPLTFPPQY